MENKSVLVSAVISIYFLGLVAISPYCAAGDAPTSPQDPLPALPSDAQPAAAAPGLLSLHEAAAVGDQSKTAALLVQGNDIDALDSHGQTPLVIAIGGQHFELAKFLLRQGADANIAPPRRYTPLMRAAASGDVGLVRLILERGADPRVVNDVDGSTALHLATSTHPQDKIVALLIESGADVNAIDKTDRGLSPLFNAVQFGGPQIVKRLLDHGAAVDFMNRKGETPLMWASYPCVPIEIARLLVARGADARLSGKHGQTALHWAAIFGRDDVAKLLIEQRAEVNAKTVGSDFAGTTPLHSAARSGNLRTVKVLVSAGAQLRARTKESRAIDDSFSKKEFYGAQPVHYAAIEGRHDVVAYLLKHGARGSALNQAGSTPRQLLHRARPTAKDAGRCSSPYRVNDTRAER